MNGLDSTSKAEKSEASMKCQKNKLKKIFECILSVSPEAKLSPQIRIYSGNGYIYTLVLMMMII